MEVYSQTCQRLRKILSLIPILLIALSTKGQAPFITTWKTDNPGTSNNTSITIPTYPNARYNYDVDWNNDGIYDELGITDSVVHDFGIVGTYTIRIRGVFPRIFFDAKGDKDKLIDIVQWGDIEWRSMSKSFKGCSNLTMSATDAPDLSRVTNMEAMFVGCSLFNSPVEHWDVSNVEKFYLTFGWCPLFNQPLNNWNMGNANNIDRMFLGCEVFNQPLGQWDVSKVTNFGATFMRAANFNQPIGNWDVSSSRIMGHMFSGASTFNQDISSWDVSEVYNMAGMFHDANEFNHPIGAWDVGNVTRMGHMFRKAHGFNQDISQWNVSKVASMEWMFASARNFNQDIGNWDVSSVTDMEYLFFYAGSFNYDIGDWDVSKVTGMQNMFKAANSFNQDIGDWNVSNVTHMNSMFEANTAFDQNLGRWNMSNAKDLTRMFNRATLSTENYDSLLIGWNRLDLQPNINFHGGYSLYCAGRNARENMIATDSWTIQDAGQEAGPPIAVCKDIAIELDQNGIASITSEMLDNNSNVSCGEIEFQASQTIFDCSNIGVVPVTLKISDIYGDSSQCISNITVNRSMPIARCKDLEIELGRDGFAAITIDMLDDNSSVSCGLADIQISQTTFDCTDVGIAPVTLTVKDEYDNSSQCIANVIVSDVPFTLNCPINIEVSPNALECSAIVNWTEPEANCFVNIQASARSGESFSVGKTTVTYTAEDQGTNSTCSFEINVVSDLAIRLDSTTAPYLFERKEGQIFMSVLGGNPPYQIDWNIDGVGDFDDSEDLSVKNAGVYTAYVKDASGCMDSLSVEVQEIAIPCEAFTFNIYPNPNYGTLYLDILSCEEIHEVEIYDIRGRKVLEKEVQETNNGFELYGLAAGAYIVRVYKENNYVDKRLLVIDK